MNDILLYFTLKYKGNWEDIYLALSEKEKVDYSELKKIVKKNKYNYISIVDKNYPENLKQIYKPPFSIFYLGNENLFNQDLISLVGKQHLNELLKEIKSTNKNNYCFLVNYDQDEIINKLLDDKINFIALSDIGLEKIFIEEKFKKILENNNLIFTEMPCNIKNIFLSQYCCRIFAGLSQKILFIDNEIEHKHFKLKKICREENIPIYSYLINFDNNIKKINSINEIKQNFS